MRTESSKVAGVANTREPTGEHRPRWLWLLLPLMAFLAVGGLFGGVSFLLDPTGAGLQAKLSWLDRTPVHDFRLPGLLILCLYGLGTLIAMAGLVWRASPGPLRRLDASLGLHWSWYATVGIGAVLVLWILYEYGVLPATIWLMPALLGIGLVMVLLPILPSMRAWYRLDRGLAGNG